MLPSESKTRIHPEAVPRVFFFLLGACVFAGHKERAAETRRLKPERTGKTGLCCS